MKLYDGGRAPNPRCVRVFLAEKGVNIPLVPVDMGAMAHKGDEIAARNPLRQLPVLELDDGTIITESIAICRYIEMLHPEPPLFGRGALECATIDMWQRRVEFHLLGTVAAAFRHTHPAMADWEVPQVAAWGEANRPKALAFMAYLDGELAKRAYVAGDAFSVADITAMIALDFTKPAKIIIPPELEHLGRWYAAMKARPSASA
ncbi:MAG: glutathione S-transferase [Phyllobacteriaceae bacterium]|nr:glutathione S-transferase [Phyllobacteriaceae bacterium]